MSSVLWGPDFSQNKTYSGPTEFAHFTRQGRQNLEGGNFYPYFIIYHNFYYCYHLFHINAKIYEPLLCSLLCLHKSWTQCCYAIGIGGIILSCLPLCFILLKYIQNTVHSQFNIVWWSSFHSNYNSILSPTPVGDLTHWHDQCSSALCFQYFR